MLDIPIRSNYKDILVDGEVFAIAAAHIDTDGTGLQVLEESLHNGPWLEKPR